MTKDEIDQFNLQRGDKVTVSYQNLTVEEITWDGHLKYKECGLTRYINLGNPTTKIFVVKRVPVFPEHWPPQQNDVWEHDGIYYHALGMSANLSNGYATLTPEEFLQLSGDSKLVYRVGNALR